MSCDQFVWHISCCQPKAKRSSPVIIMLSLLTQIHTLLSKAALFLRHSQLRSIYTNGLSIKICWSVFVTVTTRSQQCHKRQCRHHCSTVNTPTGIFNPNSVCSPAVSLLATCGLFLEDVLNYSTFYSAVKVWLWHNQATADSHKVFVQGTPETPLTLSSITIALL